MSTLSLSRLALSAHRQLGPVQVSVRLFATGRATAACIWCTAVGSVGVLGHGATAAIALGVLGLGIAALRRHPSTATGRPPGSSLSGASRMSDRF